MIQEMCSRIGSIGEKTWSLSQQTVRAARTAIMLAVFAIINRVAALAFMEFVLKSYCVTVSLAVECEGFCKLWPLISCA